MLGKVDVYFIVVLEVGLGVRLGEGSGLFGFVGFFFLFDVRWGGMAGFSVEAGV